MEKIDYVYDEFSFPKKKLQDVEFEVSNTYFTKEAVVIYKSGQVAYIPYNKLQAVSFFAQTRSRFGSFIMHTGFIKQNHPYIEADSDLIYEGILF